MPTTTSDSPAIPSNATSPDRRSSLTALTDPVSPGVFLQDYWEKRPLVVHRNRPDYFHSLLSRDEIDRALTTLDLGYPEISMVSSERNVVSSDYTRDGEAIDLPRLFQLFADGVTIILAHLHTRLPSLAEFCRALEAELSAPCQTNIYLTPAKAKGFKPHFDTHDVFILQVEHSKRWRIYGNPVPLPFRGQDFDAAIHEPGPVQQEIELDAGDTLYIPRGYVHDAESLLGPSLHITFGVLAYTWTDVIVEALAATALKDPAFRSGLPVGFATESFDPAAAHQVIRGLLQRFCETADPRAALDAFADDLVRTRVPLLRGQMTEIMRLESLHQESTLGPRPDLIYRLHENDTSLVVACYGNEIAIPKHAAAATVYALRTPRFRVRELPGVLDEAGKLVLVRRLVREGLLRFLNAE